MKRLIVGAALLLSIAAAALLTRSTEVTQQKHLIEWGWDTPRLQQISPYLPAAQQLPFDGVIIDVESSLDPRGLSWTIMTGQRIDSVALDTLIAEYADLEWGRMTENFLRLTMYAPERDWFDDWNMIYLNIEDLSRFAREMGFVGIVWMLNSMAIQFCLSIQQCAIWTLLTLTNMLNRPTCMGSHSLTPLKSVFRD